jgi:hypothetical protein
MEGSTKLVVYGLGASTVFGGLLAGLFPFGPTSFTGRAISTVGFAAGLIAAGYGALEKQRR